MGTLEIVTKSGTGSAGTRMWGIGRQTGPTLDGPREQHGAGDDTALVARAKHDRAAFGELYDRYVGVVYGYAERCLGDPAAAEDATSTVFLKALQAIGGCDEARFRSWLFAIAHNVIADARRRRPTFDLAHADQVADASWGGSPEGAAIAGDEARSLRRLLVQLPPDQRELIELRLAGLSDLEIARAVGRSHGAVRTAQHRAIQRLRALSRASVDGEGTDR